MNLTKIRPDDIVRVDRKGRVFEALMLAKRRASSRLGPIHPGPGADSSRPWGRFIPAPATRAPARAW
jgi:hypothetical protein